MSFFQIITYLGYLVLLLNTFLYLKSSIKNNSRVLKVFSLYLIIIVTVQIISKVYHYQKIDNLFMSHYYFIGQLVSLTAFFYYIFLSEKLKNVLIYLSFIIVVSLVTQYIVFDIVYNSFNLFEILVCSVPLILYSVLFFYQTLDSNNKKYIYINSGIFLYILSSTLIFSAGNMMPDLSSEINKIIWHANVSLYLVYQILIFIEWYKNFRKKEVNA